VTNRIPSTPRPAIPLADVVGGAVRGIESSLDTRRQPLAEHAVMASASPLDILGGFVNGVVNGATHAVRTISNYVAQGTRIVLNGAINGVTIVGKIVQGLPQQVPGVSLLASQMASLAASLANRLPSTPTSRLYSTLRSLTADSADADGFVIKTVHDANGQARLVVYIGGTVPLSSTNQPLVENAVGWDGTTKSWQLYAVQDALGGNTSEPVMLVGYSQGGMDAQNLAYTLSTEGYAIAAVVAFASPYVRTPGASYQTIFLQDRLDPIAGLSREGISIPSNDIFTGSSSTDLDPGVFNLDVHTKTATYVEIGKRFDAAAGYSDVKRTIRQFEDVGTSDGTTQQVRIVLRWGSSPDDLDSHLTGPGSTTDAGNRFHIYYGNRTAYIDGQIAAQLANDDTSGYGPETTTISDLTPGDYYFYVYNYSGDSESGLAQSGATVGIYTDSASYFFSADGASNGYYWSVFELTISPNHTVDVRAVDSYGDSPIDGVIAS
jgi:pimeloyl-ACP methyl ester carboxylesterase